MKQMKMVRYFKSPEPVREISLVIGKNFIKNAVAEALSAEIQATVPTKMISAKGKKIPVME